MQRVIITGSNGTGKSHVARELDKAIAKALGQPLASAAQHVPVISYDSIRLTRNWIKRSQDEIDATLSRVVEQERWILEGGPSLLEHALPRCQGVIWLDPPEYVRAWRLALRPWKNLGRSRAELPSGNADWPLQQYCFALRSLRHGARFRQRIGAAVLMNPPSHIWRCRNSQDVENAIRVIVRGISAGD